MVGSTCRKQDNDASAMTTQSLWKRAQQNSEEYLRLSRCLRCGETPRIQECNELTRLFCDRTCQEKHYQLACAIGALPSISLGMPKRLLELTDDETMQFPDEILCELVLQAYHAGYLDSDEELRELLALRKTSQQYARVIKKCVIPRIWRLAPESVWKMPLGKLFAYSGLEELELRTQYVKNKELGYLLMLGLLPRLRRLTVVRWPKRGGDDDSREIARALPLATALIELTLDHIWSMPIDALEMMTQLRALRLRDCRTAFNISHLNALTELDVQNNDGAYYGYMRDLWQRSLFAEKLPSLRVLVLPSSQRVDHLERMTALERLSLESGVDLDDDTLTRLTTLTELTLPHDAPVSDHGLAQMTQLRCLDISECPWFTLNAIEPLQQLEYLLVFGEEGKIDIDEAIEVLPGSTYVERRY